MRLTPEMIRALEAIGVRDPKGSRRRQSEPQSDPTIHAMEWVCFCTGAHRRITMVPFEWQGATILLGQCSDCLAIRWCFWRGAQKTWTGRRTMEPSRDMYEKGKGK